MTRRVREPVLHEEGKRLIRDGMIAFVENEPSPKWISRPKAEVEIFKGNHMAEGVAGFPGITPTASGPWVTIRAP